MVFLLRSIMEVILFLSLPVLAFFLYFLWKYIQEQAHDNYDKKASKYHGLLKWLGISLLPLAIFFVLRFIWWPIRQHTLNAEIARQMDYSVVWYHPDRPSYWTTGTCIMIIALIVIRFIFILKKDSTTGKKGAKKPVKKNTIQDTIAVSIVFLFVLWFGWTRFSPRINISAVYFGSDKVAVVSNWYKDEVKIWSRDDLSYHIDYWGGHSRSREHYKIFYLHNTNGDHCKIPIELEPWGNGMGRFSIDEVRCDREAVIRTIESLPICTAR